MLRPLWESREHYEELKQLDDAMKEVNKGRAEDTGRRVRDRRPGRTKGGHKSQAQ